MKRIFITFTILAATLLMSGCVSKNDADSTPSPTISSDVVTQTQAPTTTTSTTSAEPPAGHLWKTEYKGLLIQINSAEMTKDVFDHQFLVFDLTLQNGTENPLGVSGRAFNLLTINKELLESDPTAETVESGDIQTSTVLPGGQRTLRVGFVVQPEQVSELIFNVGQNAVYRITSFDDSSSSPAEATATVTPAEEPSSTENTPAIEGGNAKSDDFIFEDNYLGYLNSLIEAINTGDFSLVEIHLLYDSELYSQQQKLVRTLSEKGTREELVNYEIQSADFDEESGTLTMKVKEQIKIISANGTEKTSDNVWTYNALQVDQGVFQFCTIAKAE